MIPILEDELRIPADAQTFEGFERWLESGRADPFPWRYTLEHRP